jgi:dUTP pyrophosphatase
VWSCSYPLTPVIAFRSYTRSLVTSSARIARTGFSFARDFLPRTLIGSQTSTSTAAGDDPRDAFPPAETESDSNGGGVAVAVAEEGPSHSPIGDLRFVKLNEKATLPTRAHDNDAGLDLYAAESARLAPGARVSVGTGLAVAIPDGVGGLVLPRSGLALRHGVTLVNSPGLIDPGYRGEVRVLLLNTDPTLEFRVAPGDRLAQLLLVPVVHASPLQADALDESTRGEGGFGSTGF